ncbi:phosphatase PAP2-related protein [Legionella fallonii]|uniref:PAP2 superfamily C-terminal n=1 Tax=Legionella fallonii LLAP-10 TaxID=1212491 RepID=A0A098G2A3_9GAMM|nr:phosphatase PAP2-related protein [Legionella fallonii]CEG55625.1 PAP2 superfamily C-terminal [Legionella fallonii LLAP-10]
MKTLALRYSTLCQERNYLISLLLGLLMLGISFLVANQAGEYATLMATASVSDLLLDSIAMRDVTVLHVHAALAFWLIFAIYIMTKPGALPFVTKTAAVFIFIRSAFICLTHLGAPHNNLIIPSNYSAFFLFTGDLFFSGHVGGPFLLMLIFWQQSKLRYFYLATSLFFAYIVLAGHIHYSIDVFAAPFITYGIYQFSRFAFTKEYQLFAQEFSLNPMGNE